MADVKIEIVQRCKSCDCDFVYSETVRYCEKFDWKLWFAKTVARASLCEKCFIKKKFNIDAEDVDEHKV